MNEYIGLAELQAAISGRDEIAPSRRTSRQSQYWKFCQNEACDRHARSRGWVTVGPAMSVATALEFIEFQQVKHATPIQGVPAFVPQGDELLGTNRFNRLIEAVGLGHFPVDQLLAYGWDRIPAVVKARPEITDAPILYCEYGCPHYGRRARWFRDQDELNKHIQAIHAEVAAPEAVGRRVAEAVTAAASNNMTPEALVAAVIAGIQELSRSN